MESSAKSMAKACQKPAKSMAKALFLEVPSLGGPAGLHLHLLSPRHQRHHTGSAYRAAAAHAARAVEQRQQQERR